MPNWTMTTYAFEGTEAQVNELNEKIEELGQMEKPFVENGFGNLWLGCLVNYLGGDWNKIYCRGEILSHQITKSNVLFIDCECAWDELPEFRHFLEKRYPGSKVYYQNEEPGMGIYTTNDIESKYFPDNYLLDTYDDPQYFETIEQAAKYVEDLVGHEVEANTKSITKALDDYAEIRQENDEDVFYSFHEFLRVDN